MVAGKPDTMNGEEDFETRTWREAIRTWKDTSGHKDMVDEFLTKTTSPQAVQQTCKEKQREASQQYGKILGKIMSKIDIFINIGNLAVKGAPESVGLAWTGVHLALHSIQDDFATFQLFSGACVDIIGILISCRLFGRMFAERNGPPEFYEIQDQVIDAIPKVYFKILDFSYRMMKYMGTNRLVRLPKGLFQSYKSKFEGLIGDVKDGERTMSEYATKASQALSLYYQKRQDDRQDKMGQAQDKMASDLTWIRESIENSNQTNKELDSLRREVEAFRKRTPMDVARDRFNDYKKQLKLIDQSSQFEKRKLMREKGTCNWLFDVKDFKDWRVGDGKRVLWMSGKGNMGKSFLVSSAIERLEEETREQDDAFLQYFFCKNGDNDAQKSDRILNQILCRLYSSCPSSLDIMDRCNDIVGKYLAKSAPSGGTAASSGAKGAQKNTQEEAGLPFDEAYAKLTLELKKKIFLVIDALDECTDRADKEFIQTILKMADKVGPQVKIMLTSRPENDIKDQLNDSSKIARIQVEKYNEEDIKKTITAQVEKLPGMSPSEREEAIREICRKAGPYFGYVNPALAILRQPWQRPLSKHLEQLPNDVFDMNLQVLRATDPRYLGFLKTCLTWTMFANGNQKVTIDEVVDAYSKIYTVADLDWTGHEVTTGEEIRFYRDQIQEAGDSFLDVDENNKEISLIKPAMVKDSFIKPDNDEHEDDRDKTTCETCKARSRSERVLVFTEKTGHLEIASTIFEHLNSPAYCRRYLSVEERSPGGSTDERETKNAATRDDQAEEQTGALKEDIVTPGDDGSNGNGVFRDEGDPKETESQVKDAGGKADISDAPSGGQKPAEPVTNGVHNEQEQKDAEEKPSDENVGEGSPTPNEKPIKESANTTEDVDLLSEADSDLGKEEDEDFWQRFEEHPPRARYEVSQCMFHLKEVERLWPSDESRTAECDALWNDVLDFFQDTPTFRRWVEKFWAPTLTWGYYDEELPTFTPLHVAACYGLVELSKRLIARGDAVDAKTAKGRRPLHFASELQMGPSKFELIKLLLEHGANLNVSVPETSEPKKSDAEKQEVTEEKREDEEYQEEEKQQEDEMQPEPKKRTEADANNWLEPPLHMAIYHGIDKSLLELCLKYKANFSQHDVFGYTALHNFTMSGTDRDLLALLLDNGADVNAIDSRGETALHKLMDRKDFPIELLEDMLKAGADVNMDDSNSQQPLFEAAYSGNLQAAELLLKHHADIHDDDYRGWTALHNAAHFGHEKMAELLVEHGADPVRTDKSGRTPFFLACEKGEISTARYLAQFLSQKDPSLLDKPSENGKTPFLKACARGSREIAKMLLDEIDAPINIDAADKKFGRNCVHLAAYNGSSELLSLLLEHGANPKDKDKKGNTPLKLCYENWGVKGSSDPSNEGFEKCLLQLIDIDRHTAVEDSELLTTATMKGSVPVLRKLLEREPKIDPNIRDQYGWTALEIARQYRQAEVEKVLSEKGAVIGKYPSSWVSTNEKKIAVGENGTDLVFVSESEGYESRFSVLSDHPIPAGLKRYYYEISIDPLSDRDPGRAIPEIAFGVCQREYAQKTFSGWLPAHPRRHNTGASAWAWHGDDGWLGHAPVYSFAETDKIDGYGPGDTVGLAVDFEKQTIFFTRNGKRLMEKAFSGVSGRLHCVLGMSEKASIKTNFSNGNFKWVPGNDLNFDADIPDLVTVAA